MTIQKVKASISGKYSLFIYHKFASDQDLNLISNEKDIFDFDANFQNRVRKDHFTHHFELKKFNFFYQNENTLNKFKEHGPNKLYKQKIMSIDFMEPFYDPNSFSDIDEFYRPCYVGRNLRFDIIIKMNKLKGMVS